MEVLWKGVPKIGWAECLRVYRWAGSSGFRELNGRGKVKHAGVSIDVKEVRKMGDRLGVTDCEWP